MKWGKSERVGAANSAESGSSARRMNIYNIERVEKGCIAGNHWQRGFLRREPLSNGLGYSPGALRFPDQSTGPSVSDPTRRLHSDSNRCRAEPSCGWLRPTERLLRRGA